MKATRFFNASLSKAHSGCRFSMFMEALKPRPQGQVQSKTFSNTFLRGDGISNIEQATAECRSMEFCQFKAAMAEHSDTTPGHSKFLFRVFTVQHQPSANDPIIGRVQDLVLRAMIFALVMGLMFWMAGSSHAGELNSSPYLYPKVLRFGTLNALSGVNQRDAQVAIEMNFDRLSDINNPDFRVKLEVLPDAPTAAKLIEQQKLHTLAIAGVDFIELRSLAAVTPLVISSKLSETPLEPYVLLSRKGVSLDDIAAMRQRRLIVESNSPQDLGRIWLETALHEKGLPRSKVFFTSFEVAAKSTRLVLPVFFGQAEACLVPKSSYDTMVELNPQVGQKLHTLMQSPGFIRSLVCIADYLDPELVTEMKKSLLTMHLSEEGRQLMMIFQYRRSFLFKPEYLTETERVFEKYQKIMRSKY